MKIKEASLSDLELIRSIAQKSWRENYPGIISNEQIEYMLEKMYSKDELQKQLADPNYFYFLIDDESQKSIGIMGVEKDSEPNTTKLHRIYLLKEAKGKGYGKLAIDKLKNRLTAFGNHRIILNVNKNNPAKQFYESQGFRTYDEVVLQIGNGFVMDDYLMEFILK